MRINTMYFVSNLFVLKLLMLSTILLTCYETAESVLIGNNGPSSSQDQNQHDKLDEVITELIRQYEHEKELSKNTAITDSYENGTHFNSDNKNKTRRSRAIVESFTRKPKTPSSESTNNPFDSGYSKCVRNDLSLSSIIGGETAQAFALPWMAYMKIVSRQNLICAATLISDQWVMSASHCTKEAGTYKVYLVLGLYDVEKCFEERPMILEILKKDWIVHPKFNPENLDNDLLMFKLPHRISFSDHIKPACLPQPNFDLDYLTHCTAAGWGLVSRSPLRVARKLKRLTVSRGACDDWESDRIVCVSAVDYQSRDDSCSGDSGGPLICEVDNKQLVVGVLSSGPDKCDAEFAAIYTKVTYYLPWIKQIMGVSP